MSSAAVREYREDDRAGVIDLWARVFPSNKSHDDPGLTIERKLSAGDGLVWVAKGEPDGAIVGAVMAGYDGVRGWIYHLAVDESHRRLGIGAALFRTAEAELERRGCPKVNLQVMGDNSKVVAFYERLGFAVEDRISMGRVLKKK